MSPGRHNAMYGYGHKQLRRQWAPKVQAGKVSCWRCGELIPAGAKWDLGHVPGGERHPEHPACNRATVTHLKQKLGQPSQRAERFGGLPDPDPGNTVTRWSRHWSGGEFNPRCRDCLERGSACDKALEIAAKAA